MSNSNVTTKTPSYALLCNEILTELRAAGVQLVPQETVIDGHGGNKNWACFQRADSLQKVYVKRTDRGGIIHTTLEIDPATPGFVAPKENGKIASHFAADIDLVRAHLLPLFIGTSTPLRAAKAPVRKPASEQAQAADAEVASWQAARATLPVD